MNILGKKTRKTIFIQVTLDVIFHKLPNYLIYKVDITIFFSIDKNIV